MSMGTPTVYHNHAIANNALDLTKNKSIAASCAYTLIGMSTCVDSRHHPLQTTIDVNAISEITNQNPKTVRSHISTLSELGIILIEPRKGKSNQYTFNLGNNLQGSKLARPQNDSSPCTNNTQTIPENHPKVSPNYTCYNNTNNMSSSVEVANSDITYNKNQLDFISCTEVGGSHE